MHIVYAVIVVEMKQRKTMAYFADKIAHVYAAHVGVTNVKAKAEKLGIQFIPAGDGQSA